MSDTHMREFWDERAREDPYFFVDNRRTYRDPELAEFWAEGERDLERMLAVLELTIEPGEVVLDIGCGVGRLTRVIAARAGQVYALDVSDEMLARARNHHRELGNVQWLLGDGVSLRPLADACVDACISHVVFQHIPDPQVTLGYVREMGRVLRPGGWAAFQISNDPAIHVRRRGRQACLAKLAARAGRAPQGQDDAAWLGSAVSLDDLHAAAVEAGLELERIVGAGTQFCLVGARRL